MGNDGAQGLKLPTTDGVLRLSAAARPGASDRRF